MGRWNYQGEIGPVTDRDLEGGESFAPGWVCAELVDVATANEFISSGALVVTPPTNVAMEASTAAMSAVLGNDPHSTITGSPRGATRTSATGTVKESADSLAASKGIGTGPTSATKSDSE